MRRALTLLFVATAAAAVVVALRRRSDDPGPAPRPEQPVERPVSPTGGEGGEAEAPSNRFVELASDERARRHEAAERLKADLARR